MKNIHARNKIHYYFCLCVCQNKVVWIDGYLHVLSNSIFIIGVVPYRMKINTGYIFATWLREINFTYIAKTTVMGSEVKSYSCSSNWSKISKLTAIENRPKTTFQFFTAHCLWQSWRIPVRAEPNSANQIQFFKFYDLISKCEMHLYVLGDLLSWHASFL